VRESVGLGTVKRLLSLFYSSGSAAAATAQIDRIEAAVRDGVADGQKTLSYMLHQLAGSSLQAGALRMGRMAKAYRASPEPVVDLSRVEKLREVFRATVTELKSTGQLD